ncbi:MAG: prepilin peptidase [Candidatus Bathyarchaeota archaeon]|nr:MAG: prepilin peptidase [Candidatus Bathyarchaeota archaeon]
MNQIFDGARIILCLTFLIYASWSDYKTREVSNKVWVIFGPLALLLTGLQILLFSSQPFQMVTFYVLSFAITSGLAIAIFYVGGFGGADAKALMCIALALPVYPTNLLGPSAGFVSPLFPITIFSNSVLLGALSVFFAIFRNIIWTTRNNEKMFEGLKKESFGRKILALISGYKIKLSKLETSHMFPLEDVEINEAGEKTRKLLVFPDYDEREDIISRLKESMSDGWVWATPGLPLLIFITAGLIIALTYGDIVWYLLGAFLF